MATKKILTDLHIDGNVGIGTTSPVEKLEVLGNIQAKDSGFLAGIDGDKDGFIFHDLYTSGNYYGYKAFTGGNTRLSVVADGAERLTVLAGGNVGIGTTSPDSKLHVEQGLVTLNTTNLDNGTAVGLHLTYPDTSLTGGEGIALAMGMNGRGRSYIANLSASSNKDASDMLFYTENGGVIVERMRINADGNVGIGTTTPKAKLDVDGGIKMADDSDTASLSKVGTMRYRSDSSNSYVDMCMQTGVSTYEWINIVQNNF